MPLIYYGLWSMVDTMTPAYNTFTAFLFCYTLIGYLRASLCGRLRSKNFYFLECIIFSHLKFNPVVIKIKDDKISLMNRNGSKNQLSL